MTGLKRGASGGKKHMWLKQNRDVVLKYREQFGDEACLEKFNMGKGTLYDLITHPDIIRDSREIPSVSVTNEPVKTVKISEVLQDIAAAQIKIENHPNNSELLQVELLRFSLGRDDVKVLLGEWLKK